MWRFLCHTPDQRFGASAVGLADTNLDADNGPYLKR
jgi:hypothetical protein